MDNKSEIGSLHGKHFFIVEDNLENRVVFQITLIKHGVTMDFERWGRNTMFRLEGTSHVDLIILDLMLKDHISGLDLFDQIRAVPRFAWVPIVAVSAMDPVIGITKTRAKGFNGFIAKPIETHLFPQQLAALMAGQPIWYAGANTVP
ncbi:MAG: response regulator [Chloroflexi bacterium]|nr:response regulator [Chloroflexota bacterium]